MTKGDLLDIKKKRELFSDFLINIDTVTKSIDEQFDLKEYMKSLRQDFSFANKAIQDMNNKEIENMSHEDYKNRLRPFDGLGILNSSIYAAREDYEFDKKKDHSLNFQYLQTIANSLAGSIHADVMKNPRIYANSTRYKGQYTKRDIKDYMIENLPEIKAFIDDFKEPEYKKMKILREMLFNNYVFKIAEDNNIKSKDKAGTNTRFEQISFFVTKKISPTRTEEAAIKIAKGLWDELSEQEKTGNPTQIDYDYVEDLFNRALSAVAALIMLRKKLI